MDISTLEPRALWSNFAKINAVPRASKKEEKIVAFMADFGKSIGLETIQDETGNVIIRKPATKGMEHLQTVVLQSHLDMVHQKNASVDFDFDKQGIAMYAEGDWVKARDTTLGADNGIGVAAIMAVLSSGQIPHPALEALFTVDEETGMTGALQLKAGMLTGKFLLNLDTEDDRELTIGCAGGADVTFSGSYTQQLSVGAEFLKISLSGLTGGHSGMDIHRGRANANKLMNRLLFELSINFGVQLAGIEGGGLRNAIPRESFAVIAVPPAQMNDVINAVKKAHGIFVAEYRSTDSELSLKCDKIDYEGKIADHTFQKIFLEAVYAAPNGIYRMSPEIPGLVQTSNNIARVVLSEGKFLVQCLTRSSVDSEKLDLATSLTSAFGSTGATVNYSGSYPGWTPKPDAAIVKLMRNIYREMFGSEPQVSACHAGLECGILGTHYQGMEMISFGPNILGAHSPDEKVQVSSVQKFWKFLLETLRQIPARP